MGSRQTEPTSSGVFGASDTAAGSGWKAGRLSSSSYDRRAGGVDSLAPSSSVATGCGKGCGKDDPTASHRAGPTTRSGSRAASLRATSSQTLERDPTTIAVGLIQQNRGLRAVRVILNRVDEATLGVGAAPETAQIQTPQITSVESGRTPNNASIGTTGVRILQLNMARSGVVSGEVSELVRSKKVDIMLLQEIHTIEQKSPRTFVFPGMGRHRMVAERKERPWAAVAICNPNFEALYISDISTTHCACVEVLSPGFSFFAVSCYFQCRDDIETHLRQLDVVLHKLSGKRILVAIDANARSSLWGSPVTDGKGIKLENLIRAHGMIVVNKAGQPPTFWATHGSSFIDVTLASSNMSQFLGDWNVREGWTTSDHNSIEIGLGIPAVCGDEQSSSGRFNTKKVDWEKFSKALVDLAATRLSGPCPDSVEEVESMAEALTGVIIDSCTASMPIKKRFRKSNPWWTKSLSTLKKGVYRKRKAFQNELNETLRLEKKLAYRSSLREYSKEVKRARRVSWREFVSCHGNSGPWGYVYKQKSSKLRIERVLNTLRRGDRFTQTMEETAQALLDVHVPDDRVEDDTPAQTKIRQGARLAPDTDDTHPFTEMEVVRVAISLKNNKAPGPDRVEVCVLKAACKLIPGYVTHLFNACLKWGIFPKVWKVGALRALLKGEDKDETNPKSYRPICLLSVVGKLFERLLNKRLFATALAPGKISDRQFGFMPGKSVEDAIVEMRRMVTLSEYKVTAALLFDISGAFDNVWWPLVLKALKDRECPKNIFEVLKSYFEDRRVGISWRGGEVSKRATRGCPQGSVLGPACWNLMFDGLLIGLKEEIGEDYVAFADDLVFVLCCNSRKDLEEKGRKVVSFVENWCASAKLELSAGKTEGIVLKTAKTGRAALGKGARRDRKRRVHRDHKVDYATRPPKIQIGNSNIKFQKSIRYLGVHFDSGMSVHSHVQYLRQKVGRTFELLRKVAQASWGLTSKTFSIIYKGVFEPTVTFGSAGWFDLCTKKDISNLRSLHRQALIGLVQAYRTISYDSACVLAGCMPIDLLLERSCARYTIRKCHDIQLGDVEISAGDKEAYKQIQEVLIGRWQARWETSPRGRVTFGFFDRVQTRLALPDLRVDHFTTQLMCGHGKFAARLSYFSLADSDICECGGLDTAEHVLMECSVFEPQRVALREVVSAEQWRWPEVPRIIVRTKKAFSLFAEFCREVLLIKDL